MRYISTRGEAPAVGFLDAVLAGGARRYVQESIAFLYRDGRDGWIDETAPIDPVANLRSATVAESHAARVTAAGATGVIRAGGVPLAQRSWSCA